MPHRSSITTTLALTLLVGCGAAGLRVVSLGSGDSRIESPLFTMQIPTSRGWTIDPLDGADTVWLSKYDAAGRRMTVSLVVMELPPALSVEYVEDIVGDTLDEYQKLGREGGAMGGMAIDEITRDSREIAGRTWYRMVYAAVARQEEMTHLNHVAGVYIHLPVEEMPARYLLINLKHEGALSVEECSLLEVELPDLLRTFRHSGKGWVVGEPVS